MTHTLDWLGLLLSVALPAPSRQGFRLTCLRTGGIPDLLIRTPIGGSSNLTLLITTNWIGEEAS